MMTKSTTSTSTHAQFIHSSRSPPVGWNDVIGQIGLSAQAAAMPSFQR